MVEFSDFSFTYKSQQVPTLKHVDLQIRQGEKLLIVGPSGSGKSTLGNCINGLIPHAITGTIEGSLKVSSMETKDTDIYEINQKVGTVLQDTDGQFVGLTVAEDIAFSLENQCVDKPRMVKLVCDMATLVDMSDFLSQPPGALSGGQKQRVSLAGVMVDDVDVLLFDEPLANLDPAAGKLAIELIDELHKKTQKTIIIIEHRLEDVLHRPVDRIVLMDEGEIKLDTTTASLLAGDKLKEYGIREPLYISALKLAGCKVEPDNDIASIDTLDVAPYKNSLTTWFTDQRRQATPPSSKEQIRLEHVTYSYDGMRNVLEDVSFSIAKGEMVAVLGKNGAGKSTMAQLLMGIMKPDAGKVYLDSQDATKDSISERSAKIGYVMQNPNHMISHTLIYDEIAFGLRRRNVPEDVIRTRVMQVLELCGLHKHHKWPIAALSYGQKKRVTIASILVMDPEVLILDEPTAGQDYKRYTALMEFLKDINQKMGITILFVTHDMHLALEYTSRAIVLADGKMLCDAPTGEVFSDEDLLERANLKVTSLYTLATKVGIPLQDIPSFIETFIHHEEGLSFDNEFDQGDEAEAIKGLETPILETVEVQSEIPEELGTGQLGETFGVEEPPQPKGRKFGFGLSYIDTGSWIHHLNGVTKFLFFIGWIVMCLTTFDIRVLFVGLVAANVAMFTCKVPFKKFRPLLIAMLGVVLVNALFIYLFSPGQGTIYMGTRTVLLGDPASKYALTAQTLFYLLVVCLKYFTIFPIALVFVFCTQPSEFASSLNRIGVSYRISYAVSLSLRYIPEITDDFVHIMHAQQARGVDISKKAPLKQRLGNVSKILAPLVLSSMDRIDVITNAMVLRGFGKNNRRTWYRAHPMKAKDYVVIVMLLLLLGVSLFLRFGLGVMFWYPFG